MKKILALLLCCLLLCSLSSCSGRRKYLLVSVTTSSGDEAETITLEYELDKETGNIKRYAYSEDGELWGPAIYDKDMNVLYQPIGEYSAQRYIYKDGKLYADALFSEGILYYIYFYDKYGLGLIVKIVGNEIEEYELIVDNEEKPTKVSVKGAEDEGYYVTVSYHKNGEIKEIISYDNSGKSQYSKEFDEKGHCISSWVSNSAFTRTTENIYDKKGNLVETYEKQEGNYASTTVYEYDYVTLK